MELEGATVGVVAATVVAVLEAEVVAGFVAAVGGCESFLDDKFGTKQKYLDVRFGYQNLFSKNLNFIF